MEPGYVHGAHQARQRRVRDIYDQNAPLSCDVDVDAGKRDASPAMWLEWPFPVADTYDHLPEIVSRSDWIFEALAEGRSTSFKQHFLGTHFYLEESGASGQEGRAPIPRPCAHRSVNC